MRGRSLLSNIFLSFIRHFSVLSNMAAVGQAHPCIFVLPNKHFFGLVLVINTQMISGELYKLHFCDPISSI